MSALNQIVKAYDIRGTVPDQFHPEIAYALGVAFARFTGAERVVIGRDMRQSGVSLVAEFARGVSEHGADVVDIGLASTDMLYFASGSMDIPGAMFTASHNPGAVQRHQAVLGGRSSARYRQRPRRCPGHRRASVGR